MNKKANVADSLFGILFVFGIILTVIFGYMGYSMFNDEIQSMDDVSADVKTPMSNMNTDMPGAWDGSLIFIVVGLHISVLLLGLMLRSHPAFYPILFIAMIAIVMLSGYISNAYDEIASDSVIEPYTDQFPMSSWVLDNFLMFNLFAISAETIIFVSFSVISGGGGL